MLLKSPLSASVKIAHFFVRIRYQKTLARIRFRNDPCAHPFLGPQIGIVRPFSLGYLLFFATAETQFRQSLFLLSAEFLSGF